MSNKKVKIRIADLKFIDLIKAEVAFRRFRYVKDLPLKNGGIYTGFIDQKRGKLITNDEIVLQDFIIIDNRVYEKPYIKCIEYNGTEYNVSFASDEIAQFEYSSLMERITKEKAANEVIYEFV